MQHKLNKLFLKKRLTKLSIRSNTPPTPLLEPSSSDSSEDEVVEDVEYNYLSSVRPSTPHTPTKHEPISSSAWLLSRFFANSSEDEVVTMTAARRIKKR